jgi:hypothetical protein
MDGDGSFVPAELLSLAEPILAGRFDLVLGTRMAGALVGTAMPRHQYYGNKVVAGIVRVLYGVHVTDLGPFRAVRRDVLEQLQMSEMTYGWPVEMLVKAARGHVRIVEVPVTYRPRLAGRSKVGGTVRGTVLATTRIFRVTFRYAIS